MIKEAQDLVAYATITTFAVQKILKKYDKVCFLICITTDNQLEKLYHAPEYM